MKSPPKVVAVTGATGYIGSYVVKELLSRGYAVHAPIRNSIKNPTKASHLLSLPHAPTNLTIFEGGDLTEKGSFDEAFQHCDAVIHTAAEVTLGASQSIITASVDGTANVLSAFDKSPNANRFVQTSSIAAVMNFSNPLSHVHSENDWNTWSSVSRGDAYGVAKTQAEQLVHAHFQNDPSRWCVCLNPGVVIGPVMTKAHTKASPIFLREIVFGNKVMNFPSTYVDVRDVAASHVNALEKLPELNDRRYILVNDARCLSKGAMDMAEIARGLFPEEAISVQPMYPEWAMSIARPLSKLPFVGGMIMS